MGQGGFGVVYKAIRKADGLPVAVKFIERRHVRDWGKVVFFNIFQCFFS